MVTLQLHFSLSSSTDFRRNQARKERKQSGIQLPTEQGLKVGHLDLICKLPIAPPDFLPIRFSCPIPGHRQLRPNFYATLFFLTLKAMQKTLKIQIMELGMVAHSWYTPVIPPLRK